MILLMRRRGGVLDRYAPMSDEELVALAAAGDHLAEEHLIRRFEGLVYERTRPYFLPGAEKDDLLQEGMLGFCEAIYAYDAEKCDSFSAFASICITREVLSAVKKYNRQKHLMLNSSISLDAPVDDTEDASLMGLIEDEAAPDMEEHIIAKEEIRNWERTIHLVLTPSEKEVLRYYMEGKRYQDIADAMNKTVKSVNNTMQRIRKKLQKYCE